MANDRFRAPQPPDEQPAVAQSVAPGGDVAGRAAVEPNPALGYQGRASMPPSYPNESPDGNGWEAPRTSDGGSMLMPLAGAAAGVAALGGGVAWMMRRRRQQHRRPSGWERVQQSALQGLEQLGEAAREGARLARERAAERRSG